jgi:hypothetical protein
LADLVGIDRDIYHGLHKLGLKVEVTKLEVEINVIRPFDHPIIYVEAGDSSAILLTIPGTRRVPSSLTIKSDRDGEPHDVARGATWAMWISDMPFTLTDDPASEINKRRGTTFKHVELAMRTGDAEITLAVSPGAGSDIVTITEALGDKYRIKVAVP